MNEGTLGNWVTGARVERGGHAGMTADDRAELAWLRAENVQQRMERDLLKTIGGLLGERDIDVVSRYAHVDDQKRRAECIAIVPQLIAWHVE